MALTIIAWIYAVLFLALGGLAFVPQVATDGNLLGLFLVGTILAVIYIATGIIGIALNLLGAKMSKLYLQVFGIVFAIFTIIGLVQGSTILGLMDVNFAGHMLHMATAAVALYAGFGMDVSEAPMIISANETKTFVKEKAPEATPETAPMPDLPTKPEDELPATPAEAPSAAPSQPTAPDNQEEPKKEEPTV